MITKFIGLIMAISLFGQVWVPATDNATKPLGSETPHSITPPGSMTSGQVVLVFVTARNNTAPAVSAAGGQTWTSQTANTNGTTIIGRLFSCVFNGTWSTNPSFSTGSTTDGVCLWMGVFDGVDSTVFDVSPADLDLASASAKTLTGFNTGVNGAWACFIWGEPDDNVLSGQDANWTGFNGSTGSLNDHVGNQGGSDIGLFLSKKTVATAGASGSNVVDLNTADIGAGYYFSLKPSTGTALTKDLADSMTLSDGRNYSLGKAVADAMTLSDGRTTVATFKRTITDNIALSDGKAFNLGRGLSDSITLSDVFSAEKFINKSLADNITLSDGSSYSFGKAISDNIVLSDIRTKVSDYIRSLSDNLTLSDNRSRELGKPLSDNIILSDNRSRSIGRTLADNITLSDLTSNEKFINKSLSDNIVLTDGYYKNVDKRLTDSILLSDNRKAVSEYRRSMSDKVVLSDNNTRASEYVRSLSDAVTLSDGRAVGLNKALEDNILLSENFSWEFGTTGYNIYVGEDRIIRMYFGNSEVSASYLGEIEL